MLEINHCKCGELVIIYVQNEVEAGKKAGEYITVAEITCETTLFKWGSHFTISQQSLPQFIQVEE